MAGLKEEAFAKDGEVGIGLHEAAGADKYPSQIDQVGLIEDVAFFIAEDADGVETGRQSVHFFQVEVEENEVFGLSGLGRLVGQYGSGSTVANEGGEWELKVYFPEAPPEKEFTVKVKNDKGQKYYFGFIHLI